MDHIEVVGRFHFSEDKLEAMKAIIDDCIHITKAKDVGTLQYDWLLNDNKKEFLVREKYINSDALLAHAGNVAAHMAKLQELASVAIEIYGEPSAQLQAAVSGMGVQVFRIYAR